MYGRNGSDYDRVIYRGTRVAVPNRHVSSRSQAQPQQSGNSRHLPHYTGYDRSLTVTYVCRCAKPVRHGDAWSRTNEPSERYDGIPRRDTTGTRITWEEANHRGLDILGKDYANTEELDDTIRQVYHSDTIRELERQRQKEDWARERDLAIPGIPFDAIWHGRTNPKGCMILPPPETPGSVFIGAHGGYRPGPTASAQGTRLQGRATTLGHSWGASQVNRGGSST
jgi:hypothetical protein